MLDRAGIGGLAVGDRVEVHVARRHQRGRLPGRDRVARRGEVAAEGGRRQVPARADRRPEILRLGRFPTAAPLFTKL